MIVFILLSFLAGLGLYWHLKYSLYVPRFWSFSTGEKVMTVLLLSNLLHLTFYFGDNSLQKIISDQHVFHSGLYGNSIYWGFAEQGAALSHSIVLPLRIAYYVLQFMLFGIFISGLTIRLRRHNKPKMETGSTSAYILERLSERIFIFSLILTVASVVIIFEYLQNLSSPG